MQKSNHGIYGPGTNKNNLPQQDHPFTQAVDRLVGIVGHGFLEYWSCLRNLPWTTSILSVCLYLSCLLIVNQKSHFRLLHHLMPDWFDSKHPRWLVHSSENKQILAVFILSSVFTLLVLGWRRFWRLQKYENTFRSVGLVDPLDQTPKFVARYNIDAHREKYIFESRSLGVQAYESKKGNLEAAFGEMIESIKHESAPGRVSIVLSNFQFPTRIDYEELELGKKLPYESFYLGASERGILTQSISELPHLFVSGTTGSGKSVFVNGVLLGVLESSRHLQMYLIDLKGGLEMIDFKSAPNVRIVKTVKDAVLVLRKVENEMKKRFAFLEEIHEKQIKPSVHKKDRIVVAIDEASVLLLARDRQDPDYESCIAARALIDSITKLSRAAATHVVLATQKLDQSSIPVSVSENITARMAFKANSIQGSAMVVGTKEALELPKIPGRGLWKCGHDQFIVQTPFVGETLIRSRCENMRIEFKNGIRKCFGSMIEIVPSVASQKIQNQLLENVHSKGAE